MPLKPWKKISERILFTNPWWQYKHDKCILPQGKHGEYHYVATNGSVMVIPILDDGRIVMVKQYRYLNERESIEFPCGGVKKGKTYEETAHQELTEETGYKARTVYEIGQFNPYNGVTNEICRVYLATSLEPSLAQPDETEEFEQQLLFPAQIDKLIYDGVIWDGMTLAGWLITKFQVLNVTS